MCNKVKVKLSSSKRAYRFWKEPTRIDLCDRQTSHMWLFYLFTSVKIFTILKLSIFKAIVFFFFLAECLSALRAPGWQMLNG